MQANSVGHSVSDMHSGFGAEMIEPLVLIDSIKKQSLNQNIVTIVENFITVTIDLFYTIVHASPPLFGI